MHNIHERKVGVAKMRMLRWMHGHTRTEEKTEYGMTIYEKILL